MYTPTLTNMYEAQTQDMPALTPAMMQALNGEHYIATAPLPVFAARITPSWNKGKRQAAVRYGIKVINAGLVVAGTIALCIGMGFGLALAMTPGLL
jgi:hypothetical protein